MTTYLSISTLNVNGLNAPIERHRVAELKTHTPYACCVQGTHFRSKDSQTKRKGMEKIFHTHENEHEKLGGNT